jgi:hypothetical protein
MKKIISIIVIGTITMLSANTVNTVKSSDTVVKDKKITKCKFKKVVKKDKKTYTICDNDDEIFKEI